jgi:aspartyl/asparaginyl beta-hydroxylase (cupin superfamily)
MDQAQLEATARKGIDALNRGDAGAAHAAFQAIIDIGRATPQLWALMAQACERLGDMVTLTQALDQMLAADPRDILALAMKGDLFLKAGDDRAAMGWYNMALRTAGQLQTQGQALPPPLIDRLRRAEAATAAAAERFETHLLNTIDADTGALNPRFAESLAILAGRREVQLQQPTSFYYPGLPQIAFYDTADFDWVAGLEAAYPAIRAEVEAVMADPSGMAPYVQADPTRPNRGHALLDDARWSAFHLFEAGQPVAANAARCPATMAALEAAPLPRIAGRSPMALFSILRPHTHIPPHWGMLNTRLICHLPLIVPDKCRLRVGNHERRVEPGKVLLFDDSVEHEAWNDSDEVRVILLFEVWRPELAADERAALTRLYEAVSLYSPSEGA